MTAAGARDWGRTDRHPLDDLAVYALDALEADERAAVEAHLGVCEACRYELAAHRAALARLVDDAGAPSLWAAIEARLQASPSGPTRSAGSGSSRTSGHLVPAPAGRSAGSRRGRVLLAAAAVALAGAVGLAAGLAVGGREGGGEGDRGSEVAGSGVPPDGRTVAVLVDTHGRDVARVVSGDGTDVMVLDGLPALSSARTYQLWTLDGPAPVSLGVLGRRAGAEVPVDLPAGVEELAISDEPAGGVEAPTGPVVAAGAVVR